MRGTDPCAAQPRQDGRARRRAPRPTRCLGPLSAGAGGDQRVESLRARFCIERGRYWQAEYWISGVRDYTLSLACRSRGLPAHHGRGFDDLPVDARDGFADALVSSLERDELLRALGSAITGLLREATDVRELATKAEPELRALTASWDH